MADKIAEPNKYEGYVTVRQAANLLGISIDTVRRWEKSGRLTAERLDGKNRYFKQADIEKFKDQQPLSSSAVADMLGVSVSTVHRLEHDGLLFPERDSNGKRMYSSESVEAYKADREAIKQEKASPTDTTAIVAAEPSIAQAAVPALAMAGVAAAPSLQAASHRPPRHQSGSRLASLRIIEATFIRYVRKVPLWLRWSLAGLACLILVLTSLFYKYPTGTQNALDVGRPPLSSQAVGQTTPIWSIPLRPFAIVSNDLANSLRRNGTSGDSAKFFKTDKTGAVVSNNALTFPDSSYLKIPDQGLVQNLNAEFVDGRKPGAKGGDLAILPLNGNEIIDKSIKGTKLADGSVQLGSLSSSAIAALRGSGGGGGGGLQGSQGPTGPQGPVGPEGPAGSDASNQGTITGVIAGAGLTGGGTLGTVNLSVVTGQSTQTIGNGLEVKLSNVTTGNTSSSSGLEITTDGLRLLGGCGAGQILKWTGSAWACSNDNSGAGSINILRNNSLVVSGPSGINFSTDFTAANTGGQADVGIDYAASGITRNNSNQTIVGAWTFTDGNFALQDNADNTKKVSFELNGLSSGVTRQLTVPDVNGTILTTGNLNNITGVGTISSGTWQGSIVGVQYGGTGANSFTTNGLLYGNGAGAIQAAAAGTSGQLLLANASGVPTFTSLGGDATLAANGTLTLGTSGVSNGTYGDGTHVAQVTVDSKGRVTGATAVLITGAAPTGSAGGDLSGSTYPNPVISKLQGVGLATGAVAAGDLLIYNGSNWVNQDLSGDLTVSGIGVATIANSAITNAKIANTTISNGKLVNSSLTVTAGSGLSGGGLVSLGGSTALAVAYGSSAGTAVEGNTTLDCSTGTGNLSGGGNTITLGSGGACGDLTISANPTFAGQLTSVGLDAGIGLIQGTGGLTIAGTTTLSSLNAAGVLHTNGSGVVSTSAVLLGTDTSGDYVTNLGSLTGLSTGGNSGPGSTPSLSVIYGVGANTAAEGNTAFTFNGSGNLSGSLSGTAGGGFTTTTLAVASAPTFSGLLTGQAGATINGGTLNFNTTGATNTNINTSTNTGNVTIGNTTGTFRVISNGGLNVTTAGAITGLSAITSSGNITFTGLSTAGIVTNTSGGQLGTIAVLPVANGGTNIASYTTGDILFASGTTTLGKLADVAVGSCLLSGGVGVAPAFGSCAAGGGITGTGTTNYVARFNTGSTLNTGQLYDDGSLVSVGGSSPSALFNVGATNQFQVSSAGAVTAVGVNGGSGLIQGTGGFSVTGAASVSGGLNNNSGGVTNAGALSGVTSFDQVFTSGTSANAHSVSATNSNGSGTPTTVNGLHVALTGNANGFNVNTANGVDLGNVTPIANNTFNAFNVGTGYNSALSVGGTPIINGTGVLQSAGLSGTYSNALTLSSASNAFTGNGSALTSLNASNLASGTVPSAVLSGTYSGALTLSSASNAFTGNGSALTSLNASNISSGTLPTAALSGTYSSALTLSSASNAFTGNGSALTSLNASNLASGTVPSAVLSGTYSGALTLSSASNAFTGVGTNLTALNASNLTSGTLGSAELSGTYSNALTLSNASNSYGGVTINTGAVSGVTSLTQSLTSAANASAHSITATNSNASASAIAVNGQVISLVGNANGNSNANTINGINFANVTTLANNTFNGLTFGTGYNNLITSANFSVTAAGAVTATSFAGSGASLTGLSASNISTGTLPSSALSGTYSNALTLSSASNAFTGNGSALTSLNASNLGSGTVPSAVLSGTYSGALTLSSASNAFTGNGSALTSLNASNLASGTVPSAVLSGTYSGALTLSSASNAFTGNGSALTSLNASNLSSGTLGSAELSGTYSNALTLSNASNSYGGVTINTGAVSGVTSLAQSLSTATNNANIHSIAFTNSNATGTATTVNGISITPTGTASGTNTLNSVLLPNVTTIAGNTFNAFNVGTGYNSALSVGGTPIINGTGVLQSAGLSGTYSNALTLSSASNAFTGNGSALTSLNASNLASGTVPSAVLSGTYSGALTLSSASNAFTGNGSALTSLNASNISSGTLPTAALSGTYSSALTLSSASNAFTGNGSALTSLNASNLASGTVPSAVLSGTYSGALTLSSASNAFTGVGTNLTALNASNLTSGTLGSAELSGTYSNALTLSNASNSYGGVTINTGAVSGVTSLTQSLTSAANASAHSITATNSNASASAIAVNGQVISLVGNANGNSNANTINGINFANVTTLANNTFNGLTFGTGYNNLITSANFSVTAAGAVTANSFAGSGASLTGLSATNVTTGTLPSAALSGTYSNALTLSSASNAFTGNGSALTSLNASNLGSGTVPSAVLSGTYSGALTLSSASNAFTGNGSALTSLNGSNVSSGTVAVARGGTGLGSYAVGDLLYASGTGTLASLADVAAGQCLISGGLNTAPSYGSCSGSGSYLTKNAADISGANITASNFLYTFTNTTSTPASGGVLKVDNGANTGSGITVVGSGAIAAGQALILANAVTGTTGNLIDLQLNNSSKFKVDTTGAVTATSFAGSGSALTSLNASNLASGTVPSAVLSGTYSGALTLSSASNAFTGNGSALTSLNASNLASGTVPSAVLSGTYSGALTLSSASNAFTGNGSALTSLNASNLASGTVPSAVLSGTYSGALTLSSASNAFTGNGSALTSLNASNISSGTLGSAELSGTYSNALTLSNAGNSYGGVTINTGAVSGVTSLTQSLTSAANASAHSITATNSNASASAIAVNGQVISLVGNANGNSNANTINGINFANVTTLANNTFNGLTFGTGYNNLITSANFSVTAAGAVTATSFAGSGASLTGLSASNISTGTLPSSALSGTYSNALTLSSASNAFTGNGSALTSLNASNLGSGTVPSAVLSGTYSGALTLSSASNAFTGNGSALTSLNASNLASGTVPSAVLSGTYSGALTLSSASNAFTGNGSALTSLNASNLSSGTLGSAELSGTYSNALTLSNASNSYGGVTINTGAVSGVTSLAQSLSTATNNANIHSIAFTNSNATGTATTVNGISITPTGTASGTNTLNSVLLPNVTTIAGNTFNAFNVGTGYNSALSVGGTPIINGTGVLQSAGLSGTYSNALTLSSASNAFTGNGSALTSLNASNISSGTLPTAALSGTYSSALTLSSASNAFTGNGSALTSLNASNLASGTVPSAVLSGTYSGALTLSSASNAFTGNGSALTSLNASNLASGTVPSAVLSGTYSGALTLSSASNAFTGNGSALTSLNASNISSGTLGSAELSGTYSNALTLSNASNSYGGVTINTGAVSGVTTLGLSGAITGATATNTINGLVINSGALSSISTIGLSGAITGATATNTINGLVINSGALSSITGITFTSGSLNVNNGDITNAGDISGVTSIANSGSYTQTGSSANTLTGATKFQNTSDSASAFQVQNSGGNNVLSIDTTGANTNNLIGNSSIETAIAAVAGNWKLKGGAAVTQNSTQSYDGANSLKVATTAAANDGAQQQLATTLATSSQYTASFYIKLDSASAFTAATATGMTTMQAGYSSTGASDDTPCTQNTATVIPNGWVKVTCSFTTPASTSSSNYFYIKQTDAKAYTFYVDAVLLQTNTNADTNYTQGNVTLQGTVTSPVTFQNATNSASAFTVQNANGANIFNIDTTDTNLLTNPGFETSTTGWALEQGTGSIARDTSQAWLGFASLKIATSSTANAGAKFVTGNTQPTTLATSSNYAISWYAKLSSGSFTDIKARYSPDGGTTFVDCIPSAQTVSLNGWTRFSCTFNTGATAVTSGAYMAIVQTAIGTARTFWIDGVQLLGGNTLTTPYGAGNIFLNGTITTPINLQNQSDSTTALALYNAAGSSLLNADTLNSTVALASTSTAAPLLTVTNNSATTNDIIDVSGNALTSGNALNITTAATLTSGYGLKIVSTSTLATATGGLAVFTDNNATTATGGLVQINANALTTGFGLNIISTSNALAAGGLAAFTDNSANTATGGLVQISGTSLTTGVGLSILTGTTQTTGFGLKIVSTSAITANTGGLALFTDNSATTATSGLVQINGTSLSATGVALKIAAASGSIAVGLSNGSALDFASATSGQTGVVKVAEATTCASASAQGLIFKSVAGQVAHICVNSTGTTATFYASAFTTGSTDLAENYSDVNNDLEPGDVVALSNGATYGIVKANSSNASAVFGVISTTPGLLLSGISDSDGSTDLTNPKPVALSGRIPTKVSTENGAIAVGDYLTISSTPGVAMKATSAGPVIGRALENYSGGGTGLIEVVAQAGTYNGVALTQSDLDSTGLHINMKAVGKGLTINGLDGAEVASIDSDGNASFKGTVKAGAVAAADIVADQVGTPYPTGESVSSGDVVAVDGQGQIHKATSPSQTGLVGVVAGAPGLTMDNGNSGANTANVAVAGRVPVNVTGPINVGDALTSSGIPGVAMKATGNGPIIGTATTSFLGTGEGQVLVNVGSSFMGGADLSQSVSDLQTHLDNLEQTVQNLEQNGGGTQSGDNSQPIDLSNLTTGDLTVNLDLVVNGAMTVNGPATFAQAVRFEGDTTFDGNVTANGHVTLGQDAAGYAIVHATQHQVHVTFQKPYDNAPIINVTLGNGQFASYSYQNVTGDGFDIVLQNTTTQDLQFSWSATPVTNAITSDQPVVDPNP